MPANLKQLTSLRFFAAAWVVAYHYWPQLTGGRSPLIDRGYLGVELFFVLSGFILSHIQPESGPSGLPRTLVCGRLKVGFLEAGSSPLVARGGRPLVTREV